MVTYQLTSEIQWINIRMKNIHMHIFNAHTFVVCCVNVHFGMDYILFVHPILVSMTTEIQLKMKVIHDHDDGDHVEVRTCSSNYQA